MNKNLVRAVRERRAMLFVGAGVSMNLGLPSFSQLVNHLAIELDFDPDIFSTHGDYLALAEYYKIKKGSLGPLRSWMDRTWHNGIDIGASKIHELIVRLKFPLIYTTNFDSWLERAYKNQNKPFRKITSIEHFAVSSAEETQIIKFHGDFDDDSTIVLTESQYFDRLDFESALDIRLRSDLLANTALFIGYSLSDINIRYMIYKLNRLWKQTAQSNSMPPSFIFLTRPNPVQEKLLENRNIEAIVSDLDDEGKGLEEFLRNLLSQVSS